jgi:hypothetical protein
LVEKYFPEVRKAEKEIWKSMEEDASPKNLLNLYLEYGFD